MNFCYFKVIWNEIFHWNAVLKKTSINIIIAYARSYTAQNGANVYAGDIFNNYGYDDACAFNC